jgi:UDP-N-acetylmuramoyl-tripeptide--D-alanyl-D-alanine ligase
LFKRPDVEWPDQTVIVAPDTTLAIGELARAWRDYCNPRVIGITGTVGKTTAKDLTATALATRFRTHRSKGNLNSREGLPLALLSLQRDHEISVLEMAMDSKGELRYLSSIAKPEIGVVLNVGLTHVSKLGSIEAIAEEKLSLVRGLPSWGTAIINADDPRVAETRKGLPSLVIAFGKTARGEGALAYSNERDNGLEGTEFDVEYAGTIAHARSPLPGLHTIPAALTAIACGCALGLSLADAVDALSAATLEEGRMQVRRAANGATILDDRYNSSPASLAGALRVLVERPSPRIALLGRMAELGEHEEDEHHRAGRVAAECCDVLIGVGEPCRLLVNAAEAAGLSEVHWFEDKEDAAKFAASHMTGGSTVLVKASRSQAFETIIPILEGAS